MDRLSPSISSSPGMSSPPGLQVDVQHQLSALKLKNPSTRKELKKKLLNIYGGHQSRTHHSGRASFWGGTYTACKWIRNLRTKIRKYIPMKRSKETNAAFYVLFETCWDRITFFFAYAILLPWFCIHLNFYAYYNMQKFALTQPLPSVYPFNLQSWPKLCGTRLQNALPRPLISFLHENKCSLGQILPPPPSPHAMLFVRKGLPRSRPTLHQGGVTEDCRN